MVGVTKLRYLQEHGMGKNKEEIQNNFEGKVAFITGSASGIGAAIARRFAQKGALLALLDQDEERIRLIGEEITQPTGEEPLMMVAKVEENSEVNHAVMQAFDRFGGIDILVNAAGISTHIPFLELDEDAWDNVVNINLKGTFLCCRAVAPIMVKQRRGTIVNISSSHAVKGAVNVAHYSASKAGVLALTKSIALELAPYGVRVNAIAPGPVDTPLFRRYRTNGQVRESVAAIPLGRIGQPEDIAGAVCFLVGPESAYMTGQTLHVNGGLFMP